MVGEELRMSLNGAVADNLTISPVLTHPKLSKWTGSTLIALLALAAIFLHLALRFLSDVSEIRASSAVELAASGAAPTRTPAWRKVGSCAALGDHAAIGSSLKLNCAKAEDCEQTAPTAASILGTDDFAKICATY